MSNVWCKLEDAVSFMSLIIGIMETCSNYFLIMYWVLKGICEIQLHGTYVQ